MKKFAFGLIVTLFFNLNGNSQNKFDYTLYNSIKENSLDFTKEINTVTQESLANSDVLKLIENKYNLPDNFTQKAFEYFDYSDVEMRTKGLSDGVFNNTDFTLIDNFVNDCDKYNFNLAMTNFETAILKLNIDSKEFAKYNTFANILKFVEYQNQFYTSKTRDWSCEIAIAQYCLSTVAVGVACVPEPAAPLACPLAIGAAVTCYADMVNTCKKKK